MGVGGRGRTDASYVNEGWEDRDAPIRPDEVRAVYLATRTTLGFIQVKQSRRSRMKRTKKPSLMRLRAIEAVLPRVWYHTAELSANHWAVPPGYPSLMIHISSPKKACTMR